ncbi:MAG TPA: GNAT family N-acetyltransferase [Kofleriaceae bacterium]|nr:GNAT family N-acetyltransferase [Kofleriaceae bacterium]
MAAPLPRLHVRPADETDRPALLDLIREMMPGIDAEARWRWMYERNPGGRALSWIAEVHGELAGCTSFFPFRLWLDGEEVRAALGGDGFVRPAFRRGGVGAALHEASREAMAAHGLGCMYGAPGAMNVTPLKRGGSREVGDVARWVRPIRGAAINSAAGRLPLALPWAMPWDSAALELMLPHDPRVDAVWAAARPTVRLGAVRDAAFYTWRFMDAPAEREPAFVIMRRGQPIGACAYELTHNGTVLRVLDLLTVPGAWHAGLRAIVRHALVHTAASAVDLKLFISDGRRRRMWWAGFVERERKPFLCMVPPDGDRRFLDPDRWFYTGADSDLDTID